MMHRGVRRRHRGTRQAGFRERALRFLRRGEALVAFSVLIVFGVLMAGIFRLTLPFDFLKAPPVPDPWGTITVPAEASAKVIYIGNTQGGASVDGPGTRQAVELALKERGTVKETAVELSVIEDRCDAGQAPIRAAELAQDPYVIGVISAACPASTLAAKSAFEEAKLPYFSINVTDPDLTAAGTTNTFRMMWNEMQQARDGARYAYRDLSLRRGLFLHDGAPDNEAVAGAVRDEFRRLRGNVLDLRQVGSGDAEARQVANQAKEMQADAEARQVANQAKEMQADFIFFDGAPSAALALLNSLKAADYTGKWMVSHALQQDPAYSAAGPVLEGTLASTLQVARSDRFAFWKETYEKDYGTPGDRAPEAYDAGTLLVLSAEAIAVKKDGRIELGKQRLVSLTRAYPYEGVTGRMGFDANGDRSTVLRVLLRFEGGEWKQVQSAQPSPAPSPPSGEGQTPGAESSPVTAATPTGEGTAPAGATTPSPAPTPPASSPAPGAPTPTTGAPGSDADAPPGY